MNTGDLFAMDAAMSRPLADRMRPATLAQYVGQQHLLAEGKPESIVANDEVRQVYLGSDFRL